MDDNNHPAAKVGMAYRRNAEGKWQYFSVGSSAWVRSGVYPSDEPSSHYGRTTYEDTWAEPEAA